MDYEFPITIANKPYTVFLQPGFFHLKMFSNNLHKHSYAEIHLFLDGEVDVAVNGKSYRLSNGECCIIPLKAYHCFNAVTKGTLHTAFQIDLPCKSFRKSSISPRVVSAFMEAIRKENYTKIAAYLSVICAQFVPDDTPAPVACKDYAFIISEYFSTNYKHSIRIDNLAKLLHLSKKQTARLVKKYTGHTFSEAIAIHRIKTAEFLLKTAKMPLTEIASYVGYQSYSGFWKAYQKYKSNP